MPITALPTPPSRLDPVNFADRADTFLGQLPTFATEANALQADVNAKQLQVATDTSTTTSAKNTALQAASDSLNYSNNAAAYAGATLWVSGSTYALGAVVYSSVTNRSYRKITGTPGGTVDPSSNVTDWKLISAGIPVIQLTSTDTVTAVAGVHYVMTNTLQCLVTLPSNPFSDDKVTVTFANSRTDNRVLRNGANIYGVAEDLDIDLSGLTLNFIYVSNTYGWRIL